MKHQPPAIRDERVVLRIDKPFIERINALAAERFEGNRSLLIRQAVRELLERYEQEDKAA